MKRKVFVGMSGGVDSSVAALLLKNAGYDVTGVFIKVWQPDFIECTWKEDRLDAMRVASQLDIPFVTLDLEKEYKKGVIDYMIHEYREGRTPNPDIMCNKEVKFGAFLAWAKSQGADYIATGHYAQIQNGMLKKSVDQNKDQTYFLYSIAEENLPYILFPIGHLTKTNVREIAKKHTLSTQNKKDSQGLCFIGTIDIKTLLKKYIKEGKGDVLDEHGNVIGYHDGATFYTLGERHGFTITKKQTNDSPYFVISKDCKNNTLTVSTNPPYESKGKVIKLEKTNWIERIKKGEKYTGRARYRAPLAQLEILDDTKIKVLAGEISAVSGQSLVLYDDDICVGGGIIL